MSKKTKDLRSLRADVSAVDRKLLRLLARRQKLVQAIGLIKARRQLPIARLALEKKIVSAWRRQAEDLGLSVELAEQLIGLILRHSRRLQRQAANRSGDF